MLCLLLHIRIELLFAANRCLRAVSRQDGRVVGQLANLVVQALDYVVVTSEFEVGAADAHVEQGVAGEGELLVLAVQEHRTWRVSGGADDVEAMGSEADGVAVIEVFAHGRHGIVDADVGKQHGLLAELSHQTLVLCAHFWAQSELAEYGVVAEVVVDVRMGGYQMAWREAVVAYVFGDGAALFGIECAAVDDDGVERLVVHDIAILLKRVACKAFDV